MKCYFKLGVAFCVIALAICASAGSISGSASDASGAVTGALHNNATTGGPLSFVGNSIFVSGAVSHPQFGSKLTLNASLGGNVLSGSLHNSLELGSDPTVPVTSARGGRGRQQQVPEGGTQLSYLAASALVLFAGIFIAGKQRRRSAEN